MYPSSHQIDRTLPIQRCDDGDVSEMEFPDMSSTHSFRNDYFIVIDSHRFNFYQQHHYMQSDHQVGLDALNVSERLILQT